MPPCGFQASNCRRQEQADYHGRPCSQVRSFDSAQLNKGESVFDQFKQLKGLAGLMGQLPEMKKKMEAFQASLAEKTASGDAGAGAVRVTVNGRFQVQRIEIDPAMLGALTGTGADADREMVEELIAAAVNEAMTRVQELLREEMSQLSGGLPGLDQWMGPGGG